MKKINKTIAIICLTITTASAASARTFIQCAAANDPTYHGSENHAQTLTLSEDAQSAELLGKVVLKNRQMADAEIPYPLDKIVAPEISDFQIVEIQQTSPFMSGFDQVFYFKVSGKNHLGLQVFCTLTKVIGL